MDQIKVEMILVLIHFELHKAVLSKVDLIQKIQDQINFDLIHLFDPRVVA